MAVRLWNYIWQMPSSDPGWENGLQTKFFIFSSVSSGKYGVTTTIKPRPFPSKCLPIHQDRGEKIFQKSGSHLEMLCVRRVTFSKLHTGNPQILGVAVQNVVATATWRPGFAHSWPYILIPLRNEKLSRHGDLATGICALLALYIDSVVKLKT